MGNKIYVGNLSFNATENALKAQFENFGTVESCKIITDRDTGRGKGFAFVEMSTNEEAAEAISQLNDKEFDGRNLRISEARPQERKTNNNSFRGGSRW